MIKQTTIDKLHDLRLSPMADAFAEQCKDNIYVGLSFEDRFGMLVDRQWESMRINKWQSSADKLLSAARMPAWRTSSIFRIESLINRFWCSRQTGI